MSVNKYNSERYYDPTAYEALIRLERETKKKGFRPIVYICSPYSGNIRENTKNARRYARYDVDHGAIPIIPHLLYPQFMDDANGDERALALFFGLVLLGKCLEIWVFGNKTTHGMKLELAKARSMGLTVRFFDHTCKEVKTDEA